jgi:hypothetical protein
MELKKFEVDAKLVIDSLVSRVAVLTHENAVKDARIRQLQQEIEELKKKK